MKRNKLSGLEAMRAARDQREAAVLAPVVGSLNHRIGALSQTTRRLEAELAALSSIVTSEISSQIFDEIRERIAERVGENVSKAVCEALAAAPDQVIRVPLLLSDVRFLRPDEVTEQILDRAAASYRKGARGVGIADLRESATWLRVTLPKVEATILISNETLRRIRA